MRQHASSQRSNDAQSQGLRQAVFDCDGTLVDSAHSIVTCMQAAFASHGFAEPAPEDIRRMVGLPLEDAIALLFPAMSRDQVLSVRQGYRDVFSGLREKDQVHEPLYHGTIDVLVMLQNSGWLLGVATGKSMKGLIATLDGHDIQDHFVTLQTADICLGKPNPDMLQKAMVETGADARSTVMIGDTTFDMEMARNAGTLAIGVAWGYHETEELKDAGAHRVVDSYAKLPGMIDELCQAGV